MPASSEKYHSTKRETNTHSFDIKFIQLSLFVGFSIAFVIVSKNISIELFKDSSGIHAQKMYL